MPTMPALLGKEFAIAACTHLGLDVNKVSAEHTFNTGSDEIFSITVTVKLTPDDVISIGALMKSASDKQLAKG